MITLCVKKEGNAYHFTIVREDTTYLSSQRESLQQVYEFFSKEVEADKVTTGIIRELIEVTCPVCAEVFSKYPNEPYTICALCMPDRRGSP